MGESRAHARKLEEEVAGHAAIRENLNRTLIEATERLQEAEARAAEIEARLEKLSLQEKAIVDSLESRRATIVEVLMVLQRMGRRPPPALLARPQDILDALRAALAQGNRWAAELDRDALLALQRQTGVAVHQPSEAERDGLRRALRGVSQMVERGPQGQWLKDVRAALLAK